MQEDKLTKVDIVVTVIIVLFACFGIGFAVCNRVDKDSGRLTLDNYEKYIDINCGLIHGVGGNGSSMDYDYSVTVSCRGDYAINDLKISYTLGGDALETKTGTLGCALRPDEPYKLQGTIRSNGVYPSIRLTVTSISGNYTYEW